jgi:hypothetical protein
MTFQSINLGSAPNDGTGDDLRTAGGKINANFDALFGKIDLATSEAAGLMSAEDKTKLDAALTGVELATTETAGLMSPEDKAKLDQAPGEIALATAEAAGLMSAEDKAKLDAALTGIELATTQTAGLMSAEDKIRLEKALTEVALVTSEAAGLMSPEDKLRLDNALTQVDLVTTENAGLMSPEDKKRLDSALTEISGEELTLKAAPVAGDELVVFDSEDAQTPKLVPAGAFAMALLARNAQSGVTYALTAGDAGRGVTMANDAANTVTIPTGDALPLGAVVNIVQAGAGATTVAAADGVMLNGASAGSLAIAARWQGVSLWKVGADEWIASGAFA